MKKITLKSLSEDIAHLNERVDRVVLTLDGHMKTTNHRFDVLEGRFGDLPSVLFGMLVPYFSSQEKMLRDHEKRISALEGHPTH